MQRTAKSGPIQAGVAADGTRTYLIDMPPDALPPVTRRDLENAWERARAAALAERWGPPRLFRFRRPDHDGTDGGWTDLALADSDACCWASAIDRVVGMQTSYGLSLCLRLLALIDLLAVVPWAREMVVLRGDGAVLDRALLAAAAQLPLTRDARFDQTGFSHAVLRPRLPAPRLPAPRLPAPHLPAPRPPAPNPDAAPGATI